MTLHVYSMKPSSRGRELRQYYVGGIPHIGVFGDEEYALAFQNMSHSKVQIRISVDGTDVLSGETAKLDLRNGVPTLVVEPRSTCRLGAWPETTRGGAGFVFRSADDSVAEHTHGNALGAMGYLSVAVYTEGYVLPELPSNTYVYGDDVMRGGPTRGATRGGPGTGAGEYVGQKIGRTTGLIRPEYDRTIQVRYLWWDDLVTLLEEKGIPPIVDHHPSGFAPRPVQLADLGSTPRLGQPVTAENNGQAEYARLV